jgi:glycosyltransferase involved in cell wall biosynthesis
VLVHVGRLEPQKGHRVLLDSLVAVRYVLPDVKLLIVGDGRLRTELREQVRSLQLNDAVIFTGSRENVAYFYSAADLVVLPSLWEGLPLTAIEAGAMQKPIVATAVDGTPEVVQHGTTGLLVPPADARSLSDAILQLIGNRDLREQMGAAGRRWVEQRFSVKQQVENTASVYRELMLGTHHSAATQEAFS